MRRRSQAVSFLNVFAVFLLLLTLTACGGTPQTSVPTEPVVPTEGATPSPEPVAVESPSPANTTQPQEPTPTENVGESYSLCGSAPLIEVPYYFRDVANVQSPTQIIRNMSTVDNVRRYVSVITCLLHDEGWASNPDQVESGYENEIVFFDKYGNPHIYPIIIGGHYVKFYNPEQLDITASLNGIDKSYFTLQNWMTITRDAFAANGTRQIGLDIYVDDVSGDLSAVLARVYNFREINQQIEKALNTGEGYPEQVPEGFFLFATSAWLITPGQ